MLLETTRRMANAALSRTIVGRAWTYVVSACTPRNSVRGILGRPIHTGRDARCRLSAESLRSIVNVVSVSLQGLKGCFPRASCICENCALTTVPGVVHCASVPTYTAKTNRSGNEVFLRWCGL